MKTVFWAAILVAIVIFTVIAVPFILLAGLNLLGYNVGYTLDAWLGAMLIQMFFGTVASASVRSAKK